MQSSLQPTCTRACADHLDRPSGGHCPGACCFHHCLSDPSLRGSVSALTPGPLTPWVESLTSGHLLSPRNRLPTSAVFGADTLTLKQGLLTAAQPQGHSCCCRGSRGQLPLPCCYHLGTSSLYSETPEICLRAPPKTQMKKAPRQRASLPAAGTWQPILPLTVGSRQG